MSNLFNPDYLQHLCQKYNLRPSKQYGQNYLVDPAVIEKIIAVSELTADDAVVEVGPGFGALTLALAEKAGRVVAFEIEKKLEQYWKEIKKTRNQKNNIEIVWGNVLRLWSDPLSISPLKGGEDDVPPLFKEGAGGGHYKVVANLPYQITSPVIRLFIEAEQPPELMVLMVQKEVAERICAEPGDMSLLSVAVQYYAEPELMFVVPRDSFWPVPRVDSAVIRITTRDPLSISPLKGGEVGVSPLFKEGRKGGEVGVSPLFKEGRKGGEVGVSPLFKEGRGEVNLEQFFFRVVKAGFAQRRKLLLKNLEPVVGKKNKKAIENFFIELGLSKNTRAQELSVEQWKSIAKKILDIRY